ncbi:MAG: glycosyl transferase [Chitinophagaceae bacterium]|nr:glycosyl transferase [Chitinophagaceae bacterium]
MKFSIIIPVFNEEKLVLQVIDKLLAVEYPAPYSDFEIVIVDDCSKDKTAEVIENYIAGKKEIKLCRHTVNKGKGAAVRTGIESSTGDVVLIQDADLELTPEDIPLLLTTMRDLKIEFVNGSRYMPGKIRPLYSYRRYYFNKIFTLITSVLINVRLTDVACGYKLFTKNIYNQISLKENRFGFEAELIIKVARLKKTLIAEVPVHYFPRNVGDGKKIRNIDGGKIFWAILKYGFFRRD